MLVTLSRFQGHQDDLEKEQTLLRAELARANLVLDSLARQQDAALLATETDLGSVRADQQRLLDRFENAGLTGTPLHSLIPVGSAWVPGTGATPGGSFSITDVLVQNPGDISTGLLQVFLGDVPVVTLNLADFRSIDYHFVAPLRAPSSTAITITGSCTTCSVLVAGYAST